MFKFLAMALLLASSAAQAQAPLQTDLPLQYLEQASSDTRNQPLVIFLHGYGSNEEDLFGIKDQLPAQYTYVSVRGPQALDEDSYQWFHKKGEGAYDGETADLNSSAKLIGDFITQATAKYHTQSDKVFLVGFSQGAIMSYEVGLRHPALVRGIAALSGKVLPVLKSELKADKNRQRLAIFIGHGSADQLLPYTDGSDADTFLQNLGLKPEFHAYPGIGHSITADEVQDLNGWLIKLNR